MYGADDFGRVHVLLGREDRSSKNRREGGLDIGWMHFGGKREPHEHHPADTALRELNEETAGIFEEKLANMKNNMLSRDALYEYHAPSKYVLYFVRIPFDKDLPERFRTRLRKVEDRTGIDQDTIKWVPANLLTNLTHKQNSVTVAGQELPLFKFFVEMIRQHYIAKILRNLK